ncbi:MAG: hypothetical protein ABH859_03800 [Pseudomonadota bacterium]
MNDKQQDLINYGLSLSLVLVIASLILFKLGLFQAVFIILLICLLVLLLTLIRPQILSPLFWFSQKVSKVVIWINKYVFMGLAYIIIFMPVGLILKLIGRNGLDVFARGKQSSSWQEKGLTMGSGNVEKLF